MHASARPAHTALVARAAGDDERETESGTDRETHRHPLASQRTEGSTVASSSRVANTTAPTTIAAERPIVVQNHHRVTSAGFSTCAGSSTTTIGSRCSTMRGTPSACTRRALGRARESAFVGGHARDEAIDVERARVRAVAELDFGEREPAVRVGSVRHELHRHCQLLPRQLQLAGAIGRDAAIEVHLRGGLVVVGHGRTDSESPDED